mmetsp:Transcript_2075/g.3794  ORF Transcript_2075/g.3794 Transcript_2075/m.3794 type:complete len:419 (+) Transcript_2075:181-1437(+)
MSSFNTRTLAAQHASLGYGELFSLKVMRFPQPNLKTNECIAGSFSTNSQLPVNFGGKAYYEAEGLCGTLSLVSDAKKVYLGEKSRMCVIISHNSKYKVSSVGVRIEVQTQKSRQILVDSMQSPQDLQVGQTMDYLLDFSLSDAGENALVCCVFYRDEDNQTRNFQKFFRFVVDEAFRLDTKVISPGDSTLVQLAVTNQTEDAIFVESVSFRSSLLNATEVTDLRLIDCHREKDHESHQKPSFTITPQGVFSHAFKLNVDAKQHTGSSELGVVDIAWRRSGHKGFLSSSPIIIEKQQTLHCTLRVVQAPDRVLLESVFKVVLEVECHAPKAVEVHLTQSCHKHLSLVPAGLASQSCGVLKPKEKKLVTVSVLPLALGIQRLSGFKLSCREIGWASDFDNLHHVCVIKNNDDAASAAASE